MKIAVASADGVSISHHFGRSQSFIVFDIIDGTPGPSSVRSNTFTAHARGECGDETGGHHHKQHPSHSRIIAALKDCSAVLSYGMGWRAAEDLRQHGIQPFVIDGQVSPSEAVEQFLIGVLKPAPSFCRCHP